MLTGIDYIKNTRMVYDFDSDPPFASYYPTGVLFT